MRVPDLLGFVRQHPVVGLGRAYLLVGALMVFSAAGSGAARVALNSVRGDVTNTALPGIVSWELRHPWVIPVLQASGGLILGFAGWSALQRRVWSRSLLEGLAWLGLVGCLAFGSLYNYSWRREPIMLVGNTVGTVVAFVLLLTLVHFLRSSGVRHAFSQT